MLNIDIFLRVSRNWIFVLLIVSGLVDASSLSGELAYLRYTQGYWQVWVTDLSKNQHQLLTTSYVDKNRLSWSSQSQWLAATRSDGKVSFVNKQGEVIVLYLPWEDVLDGTIAPDGQSMVFSVPVTQKKDNNDLWLLPIVYQKGKPTGFSTPRQMVRQSGLQFLPVMSIDGRYCFYHTGTYGKPKHIWSADLTQKPIPLKQWTTGKASALDVAVLGESKFVYTQRNDQQYDIWLYDESKKQRYQRLTTHGAYDAQPAISSDHQWLAFYSLRNSQRRLWVKPLANNKIEPIAVTPATTYSRQPVWLD